MEKVWDNFKNHKVNALYCLPPPSLSPSLLFSVYLPNLPRDWACNISADTNKMWNPAGRVYELLRAQQTERGVWELCSIPMNQRPLCHCSEKTSVVWEQTQYFHIRSISAESSGMQLNCAYFLPHSKANFCPPLDQSTKLIGNVLPMSTLQTLTYSCGTFI